MSDPATVSAVMREMAEQRWGAQKPIRLAQEVAERADELPGPVLDLLIDELTKTRKRSRHG